MPPNNNMDALRAHGNEVPPPELCGGHITTHAELLSQSMSQALPASSCTALSNNVDAIAALTGISDSTAQHHESKRNTDNAMGCAPSPSPVLANSPAAGAACAAPHAAFVSGTVPSHVRGGMSSVRCWPTMNQLRLAKIIAPRKLRIKDLFVISAADKQRIAAKQQLQTEEEERARLDAYGNNIAWTTVKLRPTGGTPSARHRLKRIDGNANQLQSTANAFRQAHAARLADTPAFVVAARAILGDALKEDTDRELPRSAAAAAEIELLKSKDGLDCHERHGSDALMLAKLGRPMGVTMLWTSQIGLVAFLSFLTDTLVLAALWVLKSSPAPTFGFPGSPKGHEAWPLLHGQMQQTAVTATVDLQAELGLLTGLPLNKELPAGFEKDFANSMDSPLGTYERSYFWAAAIALASSLLISAITGACSPAFGAFSACKRWRFLLVCPFNLHVLYMGYEYAVKLEAASDVKSLVCANDLYRSVVTLKMLHSVFESLPMIIITGCALEMTEYWRLFLAAQLMSIISMSYGFFAYAAQLFCDKLARRGCMHAQLLLCMFMHFCWEVLAITSFVATRSLGFWRWSCLPVLFFIGFQQLAPSLRAVSSAVGWGSYLCALLAMSPLACLAAAIDGPLLGFASMYSRGKGFTVGALDRAVAGGRRFILFVSATIALVAYFVHLPPNLASHTIELGGLQLTYYDMRVLSRSLSVVVTHRQAFFTRAALVVTLFVLDLLASARAWQLCGFANPGNGILDLITRCVGSCSMWSSSRELEVRSYSKLKVAPGSEATPMMDNVDVRRLPEDTAGQRNDQQQTLGDALETLHEYFCSFAGAAFALDLEIAACSDGRSYDRGTTPMVDYASEAQTQESAIGMHYGRPLDIAQLGYMAASECATMLRRLYQMSASEMTDAEIAISNFVPPIGVQPDSSSAIRELIEGLRQAHTSVLQRQAQGVPLARRLSANSGSGAPAFRSLPLKTALAMPQLWSRARQGYSQSFYALSKDSPSATYFVSHCWADPGKEKLTLLRHTLCMQPLIASLLVYLPIMAVILFPLGLSIHHLTVSTSVSGLRFFGAVHIPIMLAPSLLPLVVLCGSLTWILLATTGSLPTVITPWGSMSGTNIWLDHACVDKDSLPRLTITAHAKFISKCDRMIVIVSPQYCTRLWCVFEFAMFCRRYSGPLCWCLEKDILILSSRSNDSSAEFPNTELVALRAFRCRTAQTFQPMDRARILSYIRSEWGSEEAFDNFVHNELTAILASSCLRNCQSSTFSTLIQRLDLCFGS